MTKFYEEFTRVTEGRFSNLKLNSATYFKDKRELTVRFAISAFETGSFDSAKQKQVSEAVESLFPGVKVAVQYIKTYADQRVVENKIKEYFNRYNQMIFRRIGANNLDISVGPEYIEVKLRFETPTYKMYMAGDMTEGLTEYLDANFTQTIEVTAEEIPITADSDELADFKIETVSETDSTLRLIRINVNDKVYARGKIGGISQLPNYICDVKGAADNIVLCGKISNISTKKYKNKRFDPSDPKSGEEELPLVRFILDDTTAKIECVCFPNSEDDARSIINLKDLTEVVCAGKTGVSAYNGSLSYTVNAIFRCEIDSSSIHTATVKPVPEKYSTIKPQPYGILTQGSLMDEENASDRYFTDKTFVIFDFEATDKFPETAEIIEIAALKIVGGKPVETFQTLVKPDSDVPEFITRLTGIDNKMVEDAPKMSDVLPDFFKFTRGAVLAGHNISGYDYPLLAKYASPAGYNFDNDIVDTLTLAHKYLSEMKSFKLESLSKGLNITHDNAHRAMSDVLATFGLMKIISKRIISVESEEIPRAASV